MPNSQRAGGIVGPFDGLDVPWLLKMRAEVRRDHPFLIWAPFEVPARRWSYGEFHERVGALAAGLARRGVKPGEYLLIHLDNCIEAMLAWFACVELGAIAVTTNTRSAPAEIEYFADHCGAVAAITQPAYAEVGRVAREHGSTWTSTIPFCMKALLEQEIPKDHKFRLWGTAISEPPAFAAFGVKIIGWRGHDRDDYARDHRRGRPAQHPDVDRPRRA